MQRLLSFTVFVFYVGYAINKINEVWLQVSHRGVVRMGQNLKFSRMIEVGLAVHHFLD